MIRVAEKIQPDNMEDFIPSELFYAVVGCMYGSAGLNKVLDWLGQLFQPFIKALHLFMYHQSR